MQQQTGKGDGHNVKMRTDRTAGLIQSFYKAPSVTRPPEIISKIIQKFQKDIDEGRLDCLMESTQGTSKPGQNVTIIVPLQKLEEIYGGICQLLLNTVAESRAKSITQAVAAVGEGGAIAAAGSSAPADSTKVGGPDLAENSKESPLNLTPNSFLKSPPPRLPARRSVDLGSPQSALVSNNGNGNNLSSGGNAIGSPPLEGNRKRTTPQQQRPQLPPQAYPIQILAYKIRGDRKRGRRDPHSSSSNSKEKKRPEYCIDFRIHEDLLDLKTWNFLYLSLNEQMIKWSDELKDACDGNVQFQRRRVDEGKKVAVIHTVLPIGKPHEAPAIAEKTVSAAVAGSEGGNASSGGGRGVSEDPVLLREESVLSSQAVSQGPVVMRRPSGMFSSPLVQGGEASSSWRPSGMFSSPLVQGGGEAPSSSSWMPSFLSGMLSHKSPRKIHTTLAQHIVALGVADAVDPAVGGAGPPSSSSAGSGTDGKKSDGMMLGAISSLFTSLIPGRKGIAHAHILQQNAAAVLPIITEEQSFRQQHPLVLQKGAIEPPPHHHHHDQQQELQPPQQQPISPTRPMQPAPSTALRKNLIRGLKVSAIAPAEVVDIHGGGNKGRSPSAVVTAAAGTTCTNIKGPAVAVVGKQEHGGSVGAAVHPQLRRLRSSSDPRPESPKDFKQQQLQQQQQQLQGQSPRPSSAGNPGETSGQSSRDAANKDSTKNSAKNSVKTTLRVDAPSKDSAKSTFRAKHAFIDEGGDEVAMLTTRQHDHDDEEKRDEQEHQQHQQDVLEELLPDTTERNTSVDTKKNVWLGGAQGSSLSLNNNNNMRSSVVIMDDDEHLGIHGTVWDGTPWLRSSIETRHSTLQLPLRAEYSLTPPQQQRKSFLAGDEQGKDQGRGGGGERGGGGGGATMSQAVKELEDGEQDE